MNRNNEGYILVTCLMMLVVLSLLGIMATKTTTVELNISANDRDAKEAFYKADSGIYTSPKVIRRTIKTDPANTADIAIGTMSFIDTSDGSNEDLYEFYRKIFGFNPNSAHIAFPLGTGHIDVDILRSGEEPLPGGSAEFASGHEGIGHGPTGGVAILYTLNSTSTTANQARSDLEALYKFIPGTAGGL